MDYRPFLKDGFKRGVINYSALARNLLPELEEKLEKDINLEGVIVAVKRYAEKIKGKKLSHKLWKNLAQSDLILKGDVVDFTLKRNFHNYKAVLEAYKKIKWGEGDLIYIYQSLTEIAVILDKKNSQMVLSKIPKEEIVHHEENLAMLTVKTSPEIVEIPGVFHYLLGLISREGISLVDIISTYTELVVIVRGEEGARAYDVLSRGIKRAREKQI